MFHGTKKLNRSQRCGVARSCYAVERLEGRMLLSGNFYALSTLGTFFVPEAAFPAPALDSAGNVYDTAGLGDPFDTSAGALIEAGGSGGTVGVVSTFANPNQNAITPGVGGYPEGPLAVDPSGNFLGTANTQSIGAFGGIFEFVPGTQNWATDASFQGSDGSFPEGRLAIDAAGNLFGTTTQGGANGDGTVFEIAAHTHTITPLYSFTSADGSDSTGLTIDGAANVYGVTDSGNVFEVTAAAHTFSTLAQVGQPQGAVTSDTAGNLYGVAGETIYEVAAGTHTLTTLATFNGTSDGSPQGFLTVDSAGDLFGTTAQGGSSSNGTVYEVQAGTRTVVTLANFDGTNGAMPTGGLTLDGSGNLYGTTDSGGPAAFGTIFELVAQTSPAGSGTITISNGSVLIDGTPFNDTIAAGIDPSSSGYDDYFLLQTQGQSPVYAFYPVSQVKGLQINDDPSGSAPADSNLVNLGGDDFGFPVTINGGAGSDTIIGQEAPNVITTGVGSSGNVIYGGRDSDSIQSHGANDTLRSGGGADTIIANSGDNLLAGGNVGSVLWGGAGNDTLYAGRGSSTVHGGSGADILNGGPGPSMLLAGGGFDTINGGSGRETLVGNGGGSLLIGGTGYDVINGGSGYDTIIAGGGVSEVVGGAGDDYIDAGWDGYLTLQGSTPKPPAGGLDTIDGGGGVSDTLVANSGINNSDAPSVIGGSANNDFDVNTSSAVLQNVHAGNFVAENDTVASATQTITVHLTIEEEIPSTGVITPIVIPQGAGAVPSGTSTAQTTDANGTVVFQSNGPRTFTLGDFFNHWGVDFNSVGVGQFVASPGSGHTLNMTVNGVANTSFNHYVVQNGDTILIVFIQ